MAFGFFGEEVNAKLWERDLQSAFGNIPLDQDHAWCAWSAWKDKGKVMMARHLAAPFCWVLNCFNFHSLGGFIRQAVIGLLKVPCSRHVGDFLVCFRPGLALHGGKWRGLRLHALLLLLMFITCFVEFIVATGLLQLVSAVLCCS